MPHESARTLNPFRGTTDAEEIGILLLDPAGRVISWDKGAERIVGYPAGEILGRSGECIRDDEAAGRDDLGVALREGRAEGERVLVRKDRSRFRAAVVVTPMHAEGRLVGFAVIVRDATARKSAAEALDRARRRYEELVESVDGIVWEADARTFRFTIVSRQAERLLGYPTNQWLDEPDFWPAHIHPDDRDRAVAFCVAATRACRDHDFEYRMLAGDGRVVWVRDIVTVVVEGGEPTRLRGIMVDVSERKRAEDQLREREADLRLAFDIGRLGEWKWDIPTGAVAWSPRCKALYGLPPDADVTYERFLAAVHPDDRARVQAALHSAVETGADYEIEKRAVWPDGSVHWNVTRGRVLSDDTGRPLRMVGVTMDVTDRKQAEELIRESAARLAEAQEIGGFGSFEVDPTTWAGRASPALCKIYGFETDEPFRDFRAFLARHVHPDDRERTDKTREAILAASDSDEMDYRYLHPDGRERILHIRRRAIRDPGGRVAKLVGTVQDITARRRAEEALREREELYRLLTENSNDLIYLLDRDGRIIYASPSVGRLLGRVPRSKFEVVHPADVAAGQAYWERILAGGKELLTIRVHDADGTWHWLEAWSSLILSHDRPHVLSVCRDITERKRAEDALAARDAELRNLAESSPGLMGTFYARPDGTMCMPYTSPRIWDLFGLRPEDVVNDASPLLARTHPDDDTRVRDSIAESGSQMTPWFLEYRVIHPTRGELWLEGRTTPKPHPDGGVIWYGFVHDVTGRKRAEDALRESEQRFRTFVDHATDAFFLHDDRGAILDVNQRACEALGYTRDELIGMSPADVDQDATPAQFGEISRRLDAGETLAIDSRHRRKDGSVFPVEVRLRPFWLGDRRFGVALVRDITDRKRAEALLNGQKRVLELVATGAPLSESLTALVRVIEEYARGMLGSILLLDEEGLHLQHAAAPSLPPEYVAAIDGASIGSGGGSCGTAVTRKESVFVEDIATDPLWLEYKAAALAHGLRACWSTPIFDAGRRVLGTIALYYRQPSLPRPDHRRLIEMAAHTAAVAIGRHRTEAALYESTERLRLAVRASNVGLWDWNFQTNQVVYSREWKHQLGHEEHEIGADFREWESRVHPDDLAPTVAAIRAYLDGKNPEHEVEFRMRHKDGSYRWIYTRGEVLRDPSGRQVRMMGGHVDITERKRAEDRLRRSLREKEVLLKEVHHRVKNNLQLISSLLALQASAVKDQAAAAALAESQNRVRAMALVHESLYRDGDLASVRLAGHVEALCAQLYRSYGVDPGRIALDLRVADLTLDLDRAIRCGLVVNELVSNALKHAFPGGRAGRIALHLDAHPDGCYTLVVADNGVGIPPAFDPSRSDSLGLQLVADLAAQLGGTLALDREAGTTFTMRFRAANSEDRSNVAHPDRRRRG